MSRIRLIVLIILFTLIGIMVCCSFAPVIVHTEYGSIVSPTREVLSIKEYNVIEYEKPQTYVWFTVLFICALLSVKIRVASVLGVVVAWINFQELIKSFWMPCLNYGGLAHIVRNDLTLFGNWMITAAFLILFLALSVALLFRKKPSKNISESPEG